jgi:hypothetical protein
MSSSRISSCWEVAAGALVDVRFPPSIIAAALVGEAVLVVVGESTIEAALNKAELKAEKHLAKELDVRAKDVHAAIEEAAADLK